MRVGWVLAQRLAARLAPTLAVSVACVAVLLTGGTAAQTPPTADALFSDFQNMGPHRAFVVNAENQGNWSAGASGPDPTRAIDTALKTCRDKNKGECTLHVVNNYTVTGHDWRELVPARSPGAPDIGRLRPQPYWSMRGPQLASGLLVWSHGYGPERRSVDSAPQIWTGRFTRLGYDLYRFDREWISDWASDATALAAAVAKAREMGYRRVLLAGQSAGAWVSLAAVLRGAPVDGVISVAAAHHGEVGRMPDPSRARSDWQHLVQALKPGPRLVIVNFAEDPYDVGGRLAEARSAFAASGVDALLIDNPSDLKGHGAGGQLAFSRRFGPCLVAFVERNARQAPCQEK